MNLNNRLIVAVWFLLSQLSFGQNLNQAPFFNIESNLDRVEVKVATKATLKSDFVSGLKAQKPKEFSLKVPDQNGKPIMIHFEAYEILSEDFKLMNNRGENVEVDKPLFFKGKIDGDKGFATLTVFEDRLSSIISVKGEGSIHIAQDNESKNPFEYWIYNDKDWKSEIPFDCHTEDKLNSIIVSNPPAEQRAVDQCVEVYLEADYFMYQDYGTEQGVMDYLTEVWVHVAALYDAEEINMNISEIFVWTSNDPYSDVDAGIALSSFQVIRTSFNGDVAHLVSTNPGNLGGIAFLGTLCTDASYGFSNITNSYNPLPNYSWTVNVLAHEIGHNLGSYHTHSCNWPQGPLDNCSPAEGSCNSGPTPTNGGTIMSYCHLTSIGIDFNNGFGTVPGDFIRASVAGAPCLEICDPGGSGVGSGPVADFTWSYVDPCATAVVLFDDASGGSPTSFFWEFDGGNPATSTSSDPLIQYQFPGIYDVSLTVTNANGTDTQVMNNVIEIDQPPIISASVNSAGGNTFQFTGSSNNSMTWYWEFGDGNVSFLQNPIHNYLSSGIYTVVATASNTCGTTQEILSVSVNLAPIAGFSQNNTVGCAPLTVNFLNQSLHNPTDFIWQFEGGTPSTSNLISPQITYQNSGNYDVSLQISNTAGSDQEIKQNLVTVNPGPTAFYTANISGANVTFGNNSFVYDSAMWDFGDGNNSTIASPTHNYAANGTYTVTLTVDNECGTDTYQQDIVISAYPDAGFSIQTFQTCAPFNANFVNTSTNSTSVSWQFPGGSPSGSFAQNPAVIYAQPGVYDVTMTVSNSFGSVTEVFEEIITVDDIPEADFDYSNVGLTYSFENETLYADQYFWNFGDGSTSTEENPDHEFQMGGTYQVSLDVDGFCGSNSITKFVTIFELPTGFIVPGETEYCVGDPISFETNFSNNITNYSWEITGPEDHSSDDADPVFFLTTPGLYSVYVEVSNPAGSDSEFLQNYLIIGDEPVVSFSESINITQVNFEAQISNANSVLWSFGDGSTSTLWNPVHSFPGNGDYLVTLTAFNDCGAGTFSRTITLDQLTFAGFNADNVSFCQGQFVQFSNSSTMSTTSYQWSFPGGIPAISTDENPLIYYDIPGVYDVTLYVENGVTNDEITLEDYIQVDAAESFVIENTLLLAYDPATIRFNYTNSIPGEYFWDFGDGTQSFVGSPVHTYAGEGSYAVTLQFENDCIELDTSFVMDIYTRPKPEFKVSDVLGCVPFTVSVDNLSPKNYTDLTWSAPGSIEGTSSLENPIFTYLTTGVYDISLSLENPLYTEEIIQESAVSIIDVPEAEFDFAANGFAVQFDNESIFETSQTWRFGDGSMSTFDEPTHTYQEEDSYTIRLEARNICGSDTHIETIDVFSAPIASFTTNELVVCSPATVQFDNQSSDNVVEYEWHFEGANMSSSSQKNPTVVYTDRGTFDVSLIVHNPLFSDTINFINYIQVNDIPAAEFDFSQSGMAFSFDNLSLDADSYEWNFGDGSISHEVNPEYQYMIAGNYFVQLTAQNDCGIHQFSIPIESRGIPIANFSVNQLVGCVGDEFSFFNLSASETETYEWLLPGANIAYSSDDAPKVSYANPGDYDVTLIAHSDFGVDTITFQNYITVQENPIAAFDFVLLDNIVQLTNLSIQSDENIWVTSGQASMDESPNFTFASNGQHEIILIAQNTCGADTISQFVSIDALPDLSINIPSQACVGETIFFESLSANVDTYTWYVDGEIIGSTSIPSWGVQLYEPGFHTVSLVGVNSLGSAEIEVIDAIEIIGDPKANFDFEFFNDQILFSDLSTHGTSYEWNFGDGTSSNLGGDQFHLYEEAGEYNITLIVSNDCGSDTLIRPINANILLPELIFFTNNEICVPTQLEVNNQSIGEPISWYWRLTGPDTLESFLATPELFITEAGSYDLYVEVVNSFGSVSGFYEDYINLKDKPEALVDVTLLEQSFMYSNNDTSAEEYYWEFGDGQTSSLREGSYQYSSAGTYEIRHTARNICGETSYENTLEIEFPGQFGEDIIESMELYPNPTAGNLTIELTAFVNQDFEIQIINDIGKEILSIKQEKIGGKRLFAIDVKDLPLGTYHVWVKAAEFLTNETFVKY